MNLVATVSNGADNLGTLGGIGDGLELEASKQGVDEVAKVARLAINGDDQRCVWLVFLYLCLGLARLRSGSGASDL